MALPGWSGYYGDRWLGFLCNLWVSVVRSIYECKAGGVLSGIAAGRATFLALLFYTRRYLLSSPVVCFVIFGFGSSSFFKNGKLFDLILCFVYSGGSFLFFGIIFRDTFLKRK
jgi:hypothetical protein